VSEITITTRALYINISRLI